MRGLIKVAALLSSTWAAAFVIPLSQPFGGVITYSKAPIYISLRMMLKGGKNRQTQV